MPSRYIELPSRSTGGLTAIGTSSAPVAVTTAGILSWVGPRQLIFVTTVGDVVITADPSIQPGESDGNELVIRYVGAGSLTIPNDSGILSNGDVVLVNNGTVFFVYDHMSGNWVEISRNDI